MRRPFLLCEVLLLTAVGWLAQGSTLIGTQFSIDESEGTLVISGRQVYVNDSVQRYALFPNASLPDTCGDRLWRCDVTRIKDPTNDNREVVLSPHPDGIAMASFTDVNNDQFSLESQFVARPRVAVNCSMTSLTKNLHVACLNFLASDVIYQVELWLFELTVNFDTLNETVLELLNDINRPYLSYSAGMSRIFNVITTGDDIVLWFDDQVLFTVSLNPPSEMADEFLADTTNHACFYKNVTDVRLSDDQNDLFVYCSQNTLAEISIRNRGGDDNAPPKETLTRFYCGIDSQDMYIEERNDTLAFVTPGLTDNVIPHPFNLSNRYVADCLMIGQIPSFIGTSEDGFVASADFVSNQTTFLLYNAPTRHKLIDGRVLYSNSTHSGFLDILCSSQPLLSNYTFLLSTFEANPDYMCPEEPSVTTVTTISPTVTTIALTTSIVATTVPGSVQPSVTVSPYTVMPTPTPMGGLQVNSLEVGLSVFGGLVAVIIFIIVVLAVIFLIKSKHPAVCSFSEIRKKPTEETRQDLELEQLYGIEGSEVLTTSSEVSGCAVSTSFPQPSDIASPETSDTNGEYVLVPPLQPRPHGTGHPLQVSTEDNQTDAIGPHVPSFPQPQPASTGSPPTLNPQLEVNCPQIYTPTPNNNANIQIVVDRR